MTKFKCKSDDYIITNTKKVKSQKGNDYQIIYVKDLNDKELSFYDPKINEVEIGATYNFELLVTISKYSNVEVVKVWKITN